MRKLLIIFILLLWASFSYAGEFHISFEWDPINSPDVVGYNMYASENQSGPWKKLNKEVIKTTTYSYIYTEPIEKVMYFMCRSTDLYNESENSNIISTKVDTIAPDALKSLKLKVEVSIYGGN